MVRPVGRTLVRRAMTLEGLQEEFLASSEARNHARRTAEWYADRTCRFAEWCTERGIEAPADPTWSDLEEFVLHRRRQAFGANTAWYRPLGDQREGTRGRCRSRSAAAKPVSA